jgi:hypothetical protein
MLVGKAESLVENVSVIEFLYQIDLFSIQLIFTKSIQITKLKGLFNYPNWISISIQHFLNQIKSNISTIQVIKFFNFKSPNFSNTELALKPNKLFKIIVKFEY